MKFVCLDRMTLGHKRRDVDVVTLWLAFDTVSLQVRRAGSIRRDVEGKNWNVIHFRQFLVAPAVQVR